MRFINKLLAILLCAFLVSGCFWNSQESDGKVQIETDLDKCEEILFSCPETQKAFFDASGCGCMVGEDSTTPHDLNTLINQFIQTKFFTKKCDGEVLSANALFESEDINSREYNHNIGVVAKEFCLLDEKVSEGNSLDAILSLLIERWGNQNIIREATKLDEKNFTQNLSPKAIEWLSKNNKKNLLSIQKDLNEKVGNEAQNKFGSSLQNAGN